MTGKLNLADFGYPIDNIGYILAKKTFYFRRVDIGILDGVMQKTGYHTDHIHFHPCENMGDLQWVRKVRFTGKT